MPERSSLPLAGLTILSFESRRAAEMAELIRRHGGEPVSAPSMREVPIGENPDAIDFLRAPGARRDRRRHPSHRRRDAHAGRARSPMNVRAERFAELLRRTTIVVRGPKPVAALRELGLTPNVAAPEPNTWRELLRDARRARAARRPRAWPCRSTVVRTPS